jgi:hypothetical protein
VMIVMRYGLYLGRRFTILRNYCRDLENICNDIERHIMFAI